MQLVKRPISVPWSLACVVTIYLHVFGIGMDDDCLRRIETEASGIQPR